MERNFDFGRSDLFGNAVRENEMKIKKEKATIEAEIMDYLENNIVNNLTVGDFAMTYRVHSVAITPIITKAVKAGLLYVKYQSSVGNNVYATC